MHGWKVNLKIELGKSQSRTKGLSKLIHIDLCGPLSILSFFGSKYFVAFINDFNRKIWVHLKKRKLTFYLHFKSLKTKWKKRPKKQSKFFKTYNGREFISHDFTKLC